MNLPDISQTAILTLINRVNESKKANPIISDPMAIHCLEGLKSVATEEEKAWIEGFEEKFSKRGGRDPLKNALRTSRIDKIANEYISNNPACTVIDLGCGFDTRFWRISSENCKFIELDLPKLIDVKKEILREFLEYELIGSSVLETSWIDQVSANGNSNFLFIAEGLFMYLPKPEAVHLLESISRHFTRSQFVLDMIPERYTKGLWKWIIDQNLKRLWGLDVPFDFGIKRPQEFEAIGDAFKLVDAERSSFWQILTVSIDAR